MHERKAQQIYEFGSNIQPAARRFFERNSIYWTRFKETLSRRMKKTLAAHSESLKSRLHQMLVGTLHETQAAELVQIARAVVEVWLRGSLETVK
jgi:hypothetical protein